MVRSGDHLSRDAYEAICRMGAKLRGIKYKLEDFMEEKTVVG